MLNITKNRVFKSKKGKFNRVSAMLRYNLLVRQLIKRNRLFFSWSFQLARLNDRNLLKRNLRPELFGGEVDWLSAWGKKRNDSRLSLKRVGPAINLRLGSLLNRVCKHGHKTRARVIIEQVLRLLLDFSDTKLRGIGPLAVLNSVLLRLEPPFEIRAQRRRWRTTYYPAPVWPHRKKFIAAKILMAGTVKAQKKRRCSFTVALVNEIVNVFKRKADCYSLKIYKKLVKLGIEHQHQWYRLVKTI